MASKSARKRGAPAAEPADFGRRVLISNRHPRLRLERRAVAQLIAALDHAHADIGVPARQVPRGELSLVFMTDTALAALHDEFLDDPTTTDVITFEGDGGVPGIPDEARTAGEICVSADTAWRYAQEHDRDFSTELALYVVHGWLHLAGYDDLQPVKKRAMRRAEARALRVLATAKAMPSFALRSAR